MIVIGPGSVQNVLPIDTDMSDKIVRPLAHNLGFDAHGQLWCWWEEGSSKVGTIIADMREQTCPLCGNGWEISANGFRNQLRNSLTDEYVHKTCWTGYVGMREAQMWRSLLLEIRDKFVPELGFGYRKIPNEYGGALDTPWLLIHFMAIRDDGTRPYYMPTLKVGSRKRVYHMCLHDCTEAQRDYLEALFREEKSTKWIDRQKGGIEGGIHAWTEDDVRRYLTIFFRAVVMDDPIPDSKGAQIVDMTPKQINPPAPDQPAAA